MKEKAIKEAMMSIENRVRHVYNQAYEQSRIDRYSDYDDAYEKGLNDAWECAKNMVHMAPDERVSIFGISDNSYGNQRDVFLELSASEAIEKVRLYEEHEKSCDTCVYDPGSHEDFCKCCIHCVDYSKYKSNQTDDIKIGDEIISSMDTKCVVLGIGAWGDWSCITDEGQCFIMTKSKQTCWKKTGRHFDEIENVLKYMKDE